jgi:histidinol dehydrogenase
VTTASLEELESRLLPLYSVEGSAERWPGRAGDHGIDDVVKSTVHQILGDVKSNGDNALRRLTERFDGISVADLRVSGAEIAAAYDQLVPAFVQALSAAIEAVRVFHLQQLPSEQKVRTGPGVTAWRTWRPIDRVGLYVPGGRARYPSSVVMLGTVAAVAGCPERVLVSPPGADGMIPAPTLVAAAEAGITEIYKVGGAQAIGALAYGTESIRPVDKIFGPGNIFVTMAKLAVFPEVAIDVPAGPSELMIVADESADPDWIAADLLANAEHGADSPVLLISLSIGLAEEVRSAVQFQLQQLPRRDIAAQSLAEFGAIVLVDELDQAINIVNEYGPEHLQLMIRDPNAALARVRHAGSVFLGNESANAAGDYAVGTNHVLPTGGFARAFQALSVEAFGRAMQVQEVCANGVPTLAEWVGILARAEGLEGHARALEIRAVSPQPETEASPGERTKA